MSCMTIPFSLIANYQIRRQATSKMRAVNLVIVDNHVNLPQVSECVYGVCMG